MIVIAHVGGDTYTMDYREGETVGALLQRFKDEGNFRFKGSAALQETQTGRWLADPEFMVDSRRYSLTAWLERAERVC